MRQTSTWSSRRGEGEGNAVLAPRVDGYKVSSRRPSFQFLAHGESTRASDRPLIKHRAYLDRPETSTVSRSHILVERSHSGRTRELSVLLVHVVRPRSRIIADPDTKVLDLDGLLLRNLETPNGEWQFVQPELKYAQRCRRQSLQTPS